ncbi:MAG TPA: GNAT family N-acetyltransferase [Thermoplasmata archaeon]|nr:GNAT family N-acetyltransferase [Thermoplasmata archaeon]
MSLAVSLALVLLATAPAIAGTPATGDFLEFDQKTTVGEGQGNYTGYTETTQSHYRYSVSSVAGNTVSVTGTGSWSYSNSLGSSSSGSDVYHPVFPLGTRKYLSGNDVVVSDPANATVWFWIPVPTAVGHVIQVLDEPLTVQSLSATYWIGAVPHATILLQGTGSYNRDDVYGRFFATYTDKYYYDANTGFVVGEQYTEQDSDGFNGFVNSTTLTVTSSSYPVPLDLPTTALVYAGIPAAIIIAVVGVIRVRRGPSRLRIGSGNQATYVRIRKAKRPADATGLTPDGSPFFGPFLPVFAERSIAEGDPVVLALDERKIVGLALLDRESGMGSLFATEDRVARVLMKRVKMRDFFAEATIPGRVLGAKEVDRFTILQLKGPQPLEYDTSVVRPMTAEDLGFVTFIAQEVYQSRAARFIQSSFQAGDLGFVALSNGAVVGFGFAMVVGSVARLHTLTVKATERSRGLGTELTKARLSTLAALGVDRVIVEISRQNTASLQIARQVGFVPVGDSVYYSKNPPAAPSALQRPT